MADIISVLVPVFNEEDNLPELLRRVSMVGRELAESGDQLEIVLVDDHSSDQTPVIVRRLLDEYSGVKYIRLSRNCGSHAAAAAGLKFCCGHCAVVIAADLQDPPETIPELLKKWREGYDVVWATRKAREGESFSTTCFSNLYYRLMRAIALPEMPAAGADFLLMDRRVIDAYNAIPEKHTSLLAMILWIGFRQTEIEYVKQARYAGKSKWNLSKKLKLVADSVVSFSYAPIRIMSLLGAIMAACGFLYAGVVVVGRLTGWVVAGTGYAALMTVLLVGQGAILLMLGILGEYLWRTFDEARGRPRYIIEEYKTSGASVNCTKLGDEQQ